MKQLKIFAAFALCIGFVLSSSSCLVVHSKGNSKPGWNKNPNNPHHPNTTNPGKAKGKHKK